ncbi:MAG: mechanosensitive ion channel family protein [Thermoanaerobaculales bacterium]
MEQLQQLLDAAWGMVVNHYLDVIAALVILVIGRLAAGWARKFTRKGLERGEVDPTLVPFVAKFVYYVVLAIVVIAVLNRLGVATTSVVAIFGAAGLAVGLALQGTLGNFASGVMLLIFRPFDLGDFVDAGGTAGTVEEIGIFSTTLKSPDNVKITVPNSQVYGTTIKNFNGYEIRRLDMVMGISYDDNIQIAMDTIRSIVTADERVLAEPELLIAVADLGDSSVDLVIRPWCRTADYWGLKFDLNRRLKEGLHNS